MAGGADEFVERYRPQVIPTVFTAEYTGDFEAVLSPWSKHPKSLKGLIYQTTHTPVPQEVLILCQPIQFFPIACHDFTVQVFWTQTPILPAYVFQDQVAEVIVIDKLDWLDTYPSPSASNFVKQPHISLSYPSIDQSASAVDPSCAGR